jgi:hypothetical protein
VDYKLLENAGLSTLVSAGNQKALAAMYDRYSSTVFCLAMSLLGDHHEAE